MPITALTTSDQCGGMHAEGRGAGGTRGGGGGSRQLYKGRSDRHRAVACWPEPVLYSPGGIVLPDIQQLFLTNLEYLYVWVPSGRALAGAEAQEVAAGPQCCLLLKVQYTW